MNLTHAEPPARPERRALAHAAAQIAPLLQRFGAAALRSWVHELGI